MVMHVQYNISLPDHDGVVAESRKLIPSVYAGIEIGRNVPGDTSAVGYSGPTFVAIRSGKHCLSTAYSHAGDLENVVTLKEFEAFCKFENKLKPIFIVIVDAGPDENPRYQKVIDIEVHHFLKFDLDAIFIATNAPGRSAFNRVERRMAPLSRELAGLILPHEHYGSHLDSKGKTVDVHLEKKNFKHCWETLAEVWSALEIDKHPTVARYIDPEASEVDASTIFKKDLNRAAQHIRANQCFTQIVKCNLFIYLFTQQWVQLRIQIRN